MPRPVAKPGASYISRWMATAFDKLAFEAAQAARIGWYSGQKLLARRLSRPVKLPERLRGREMPESRRLYADLRQVLEQDWRNVADGLYAMPEDWRANPLAELRRAGDFFSDLGARERRRHGGPTERIPTRVPAGPFP